MYTLLVLKYRSRVLAVLVLLSCAEEGIDLSLQKRIIAYTYGREEGT